MPHKRQSEGKNVANKLSAMPPTDETKEAVKARCFVSALVPVDRVGYPLLLKTSLPRPADATGAPPGRMNLSQYSGVMQHRAIAGGGSGSRAMCRRTQFGAISYYNKLRSVITPEAIAASHRTQTE